MNTSTTAHTSASGRAPGHAMRDEYDVIVVGAGSAGSAFAGTLAAKGGRSILLVDAGPVAATSTDRGGPQPQLWSLEAMTDPRWSVGDVVDLGGGRTVETRRGRVFGGSSAVNGGYFVRATAIDLERLSQAGGGVWSVSDMLGSFIRIEDDLDLGDLPGHGDSGPVPVWRDGTLEPVTAAFFAGCASVGFDAIADLNGEVATGAGMLPFNARLGRRVDAAAAFLDSAGDGRDGGDRAELSMFGSCSVERVLIADGQAIGVELVVDGERRIVRAGRVVLSAGALGSATLLMRSGVGPAHHLRAVGVDVVHDAPGVGSTTCDHPSLDLSYLPRDGVVGTSRASFMQGALHTDDPDWGGVVEVMATRRPYGVVTGNDPSDELLSLRVTLMSTASRGTVRLASPYPGDPPIVESHYLDGDGPNRDQSSLRAAVRRATEMIHGSSFSTVVERWVGPTADEVADDRALGGWLAVHLGTAFHLSGSCPIGPADDPSSVVDGRLHVHGVTGLCVVDASVLPAPLSRGPAATVMMIGELAAQMFD